MDLFIIFANLINILQRQNIIIKMDTNDITVDTIIRKYQQRQQHLCNSTPHTTPHQHHQDSSIYIPHLQTGRETPQFNSVNHHKDKQKSHRNEDKQKSHRNEEKSHRNGERSHRNEDKQKTQKKKDGHGNYSSRDMYSSQFQHQELTKKEQQILISKLHLTEERLATSQKNYTQMWKKYEALLKQSKKSGKAIELEQKLRQKEASQLQLRINSYEREIVNLKECITAKDANLSALRDKLKEKNERIVEAERLIDDVKVQLNMFKAKQARMNQEEEGQRGERQVVMLQMREEMQKFERIIDQKQMQKKGLLLQMQKNYIAHKEELQVLRLSYSKVEEEYKQWIQKTGSEKMEMMRQYEQKLKQSQKIASALSNNSHTCQYLQKQLTKRETQIQAVTSQNQKLINDLKNTKISFQNADKTKQELIIKISTLENNMIEKVNYQKMQQEAYNKLQGLYRSQQDKNKGLTHKYNILNSEFQQLKNKCSTLFQQSEQRKQQKDNKALEIIKLRKEIVVCRQQLQRSKNSELSLTTKLNQTMTMFKGRACKFQQEKQQIMTQLLAQRLQKAKLKDQLQQTKAQLKKEYELSLQNTKKQLQQKMKKNSANLSVAVNDVEKEQLYLQLRQLQRRYQLLASQIVTVDDFMGMATKAHRRYHQPVK